MTIVYEVNILVKKELSDRYLEWLVPHAKEMYPLINGLTAHTITRNTNVDRTAIPRSAEKAVFGASVDAPGAQPDGTVAAPSDAAGGTYFMDSIDYHLFTARYTIASRDDLDEYLEERAGVMRAAVSKAFSAEELSTLVFWRRILDVVA